MAVYGDCAPGCAACADYDKSIANEASSNGCNGCDAGSVHDCPLNQVVTGDPQINPEYALALAAYQLSPRERVANAIWAIVDSSQSANTDKLEAIRQLRAVLFLP